MVYQRVLYPDGHVEFPYVSDGVMGLLGVDAQSAMKNPSLLLELIHPEDRVRVYDAITRSAKTFEQLDF